jgi:predicted ATPase
MHQLADLRITLPPDASGFPYDIAAIRTFPGIRFETPVTLLVGENGSGKSTLLEALAIASRAITVGSAEATEDATLEGIRGLASAMRLSWTRRSHRGFFLRAEDFFGFAKRMTALRSELEAGLAAVDREYEGRPGLAHDLARTPYLKELGAIEERYGAGLDARSHGEAFLRLFQARMVPGGLYLLDEPEAPLSPLRQIAFLALVRELVAAGSQLVIATHSPILLAAPDATIWSFDREPIAPVAYDQLEHVTVTRDFLADPDAFLRHL